MSGCFLTGCGTGVGVDMGLVSRDASGITVVTGGGGAMLAIDDPKVCGGRVLVLKGIPANIPPKL